MHHLPTKESYFQQLQSINRRRCVISQKMPTIAKSTPHRKLYIFHFLTYAISGCHRFSEDPIIFGLIRKGHNLWHTNCSFEYRQMSFSFYSLCIMSIIFVNWMIKISTSHWSFEISIAFGVSLKISWHALVGRRRFSEDSTFSTSQEKAVTFECWLST